MDPLLQRALAGDAEAQRQLVDDNAAALRRYLDRRMGARLRRAVSAADLSQDVFARVFAAMAAMPAEATARSFRLWLFRHANFVLANHGGKAQRAVGESAVAPGDVDVPAAVGDSSTGDVTRGDQVAWLRALLDRLEPKYRDVVRLRLEGLSFGEIAAQLDLQAATARQRFARVMRVLKEQHGGP